ncbi:MAG: DJ-1/PfpI family protein [Defluviitaleaceae bacterium]|nr:DJ-1/PfpI family protein [Defluviitaleaceae bacterium]MCL2836144.1 DJ-1/PfpI family protein [Defluviitaleaceae bacterium]
MIPFNVILFDDFETLDVYGPVEIIGKIPDKYGLGFYSVNGGVVVNSHQVSVNTLPFSEMDTGGVLLIPGGMGTRKLVDDADFIARLKALSQSAPYVLTVCTGSALLARTGLLRGKNATTNKRGFDWVSGVESGVHWARKARWVIDGKYYTSSGVSAGIDMTLGFISDVHGEKLAEIISGYVEYIWNRDKDSDPFAVD